MLLNILNSVGLLINSIDRLIAIAYPLFYYRKEKMIITELIIAEYIIAILPLMVAIIFTAVRPPFDVSYVCR